MRILIIGGTSFMGLCAVKLLIKRGHEVAVFHRGSSNYDIPKEVKHIYGSRERICDKLEEIKKFKPEVVVNMLLYTKGQAEEFCSLFSSVCSKAVVISSGDVYHAYEVILGIEEGLQPVPIKEMDELRQRLFPLKGLVEGELGDNYDKILVEKTMLSNKKLPCAILRMPAVYGPNDKQMRMFEYIKPMIDNRPYILMDEGLASWKYTKCYVENAAKAIVMAVEDKASNNKIFNVGEEISRTELEWAEKISEILKWKGRFIKVPKGKLMEEGSMNTRQNWIMDTSKIREELFYTEEVEFLEGLKKTVEWELKSPYREKAGEALNYEKEDEILRSMKFHLN